MSRDVAMVVASIVIIGWGLGSWWIPVCWILLVGAAVAIANARWAGVLRRRRGNRNLMEFG